MTSSENLIEKIRRLQGELRRSDKKVSDTILENPSAVPNMKLAELAKISGVSEPTVVRFCNSIGCDGFQDMKIKLASSLAFGLSSSHAAISEDDEFSEVITKIFDFNLTSLDWVRHKLDHNALSDVVELILNSHGIYFVGLGASSIVAQDAQQKFPLFGVPCQAIVDAHQMIITASMLGKGDVLVAISNSGNSKEIIQAARIAREHGASVVALTGSENALGRSSDVTIVIDSLDNTDEYTPTISRMAALVVIDILSTYVALRRPPEQREKLINMKKFLSDVRQHGIV